MKTIRCATLTPAAIGLPRIAVETARAGGVGLLDAVHLGGGQHAAVAANLRWCLEHGPATAAAAFGLRVAAREIERLADALDAFGALPHWVIVADWSADELPGLLQSLARDGRTIWIEARGADDLARAANQPGFHGWAGCGAECGGLAGAESAFVLAQRLARAGRPFIMRGGIGVHSAAACAVAGADAVVLDDVLHLLRESSLPPRWRHVIERVGLADTVRVGAELGLAIRTLQRPELPVGKRLIGAAEQLSTSQGAAGAAAWGVEARAGLGWDDPERAAWPVGEGVGLARSVALRFRSVGRLVAAVQGVVQSHVASAAAQAALAEGAPLAERLGTTYPIVQGPMTRVSDTAAFAGAVAGGGALPLVALALLRGPETSTLLAEVRDRLGDRPWGVGILGFVPPAIRREQMTVVEQIKPAFALIAGGLPDQVTELERAGIAAFLHAPAPLLRAFLQQGVRRVVFEGAECGGHVGPLHSFTLWDCAVDTIVTTLGRADAEAAEVLFAGGIHDGLSAAMVAALAAPLADHGVRWGVLMGTAYLFTNEAVACGAITPGFQREVMASDRTVTISTGPGHVIRCAPTPFTAAFAEERRALAASGVAGEALSRALDQLVVGRSRVASKGLERVGEALVGVDEARQRNGGLFMLGEAAALRDRATTIAELHRLVSDGAAARLAEAAGPSTQPARAPRAAVAADIAIVGVSCLVPGARAVEGFWRNMLDLAPAISEIPRSRWDIRLYYDERAGARDRIVSKWGGFVDPIPFDPLRFGIPPKSLPSITPSQLVALELTRRALVDAGFEHARPPAEVRERTGVVFAIGNTGDLEQLYMTRAALPLVVGPFDQAWRDRLPEWTEESYPGLLPSVTAGRVANRFDFGGPNLTIDAACASSLAALDVAVRELADGRSDMVVAGGLDFEMSPQAFMGFSHTRALSPRGRADVFDRGADGIVISEGAVILVLKRLADAERDGDRVYAVVKGVGASSDGRGLSMTAPKPAGQRLALTRAYERAGLDPASIRLYEAHATGTALGDASEAEAVSRLLRESGGRPDSCAIGSAKSLLGHTRTAAGMVAVLKTALALHHRVLPPHAGVETPLPEVAEGPLYLLKQPQPWLAEPGQPRRAGVSAFGFGGTNVHVVVEEHRAGIGERPLGSDTWPCELFVLAAADRPGLHATLDRLDAAAERLQSMPADGSAPPPFTTRELAYASAVEARGGGDWRVGFVAASADEIRRAVAAARLALSGEASPAPGVFVGQGPAPGTLGWLFPGQGSQYPGMGREAAVYLAEVRDAVESAAGQPGLPASIVPLIWPRAAYSASTDDEQRRALADTAVAQPAIALVSCGLMDVMRRIGLAPSAVAGHSFGEFVALHAAGALDRGALVSLAIARGRAMASVGADAGTMAMLGCGAAGAARLVDGIDDVVVANFNAPAQVVVSGTRDAVAQVIARARDAGHAATPLTVSGAFHSPIMRPARAGLTEAIGATVFHQPSVPVHANADGRPYPGDPAAIAERLGRHLEEPVDFVAQVEAMYAAGVRTFVELGPGRVLSGLVRRTLGERQHLAIPADGGLRGLLDAVARLHAAGHLPDAAALFDGRPVRWVDLDRLPEAPDVVREWWLDGGHVWPAAAGTKSSGVSPLLTLETAREEEPIGDRMPAPLPAMAAPPRVDGASLVEYYRAYEDTMRRFLDQQERMLEQVLQLARGGDIVPRTTPEARPEEVSAAPRPAPLPVASDPGSLTARLVKILVDRTGYADSVIGPDLDLEADLGIDSIKRIEMITTFAASFPEDEARRLQKDFDRLTRLRTLNAIATSAAATLSTRAASAATPAPDTIGDSCPRFVMELADLPPAGQPRRLSGLHLVAGGSVATDIAGQLSRLGAEVGEIATADLLDADRLAARLRTLTARAGPVQGIVHVSAIGRAMLDRRDAGAWRVELDATVRSLFALLKATVADLAAAPDPVVLSATALGGTFGRDRFRPGAEIAAGCHGLLRAFQREYPEVRTLIVDVDETTAPVELARQIAAEYLSADHVEVGIRDGRRRTLAAADAPSVVAGAGPEWKPEAGWVVLATGGTRGITAEVCRTLAAPGVRFVLIDRGRPHADPAIDRARREHLDRLRAAGAVVEVVAADVGDDAAFGTAIEDVYRRHGRIDAVLHGAGQLHDQRFELKTVEGYDRVFQAKVGGALTLARHLRPDNLRWMVFFASVSGRFGNAGQTDYSAANEILNRVAWSLRHDWPHTRVVSINWGPWEGVGMADAATLAVIKARGFHPIAPGDGCRAVVEELGTRALDEVEVIAGAGPWGGVVAASRPAAGRPSGR